MRKQINIRNIFLIIGICLLITAAVLLVTWQLSISSAESKTIEYVSTIRELIPEPQGAVPEERRDNTMSSLSVDGTDFIGIMELPRFGSVLPVCTDWKNTTKYPCRFDGSIYDRSLIIGGTTQKGQYSFYRDISVGDSLLFTDTEGNLFSYNVTDIRYSDSADLEALQMKDSDLTLFIKNIYAFEYIIIYCKTIS